MRTNGGRRRRREAMRHETNPIGAFLFAVAIVTPAACASTHPGDEAAPSIPTRDAAATSHDGQADSPGACAGDAEEPPSFLPLDVAKELGPSAMDLARGFRFATDADGTGEAKGWASPAFG